MDIEVFTISELPVALGALRRIHDSPRAQQLRAALAEIHRAEATAHGEPLPSVATLPSAHARRRLLQLAIITALVDGDPTPEGVARVHTLAQQLRTHDPGLRVLRHLAAGRRRLARLAITRRIIGRFFVDAWRRDGLPGVWRIAGPLWFGRGANPAVAWRYRELGRLPRGSLGHTLWDHVTERHFGFPGEAGAIPEALLFHDIGHILTGFGTEPEGEIQQGAFQAGFVRRDGFCFLLFAVLQFHLGVKITPVAPAATGYFDVPAVMHALARGARCRDLSEGWRIWDDAHRPLEEVRQAYGLPV